MYTDPMKNTKVINEVFFHKFQEQANENNREILVFEGSKETPNETLYV